ncbi:nuclear transport factor 2 [Histoplasma capsulatum G186AR]|uniref:Nuclear transport factor 2 n=1 Tax=Ajellomyces capsulatus (strain G186AR / H82 / ATCC MYA-2454 / RMSCC 2432) TaxID=447093 RepID=C0NU53_AJECG|nr:nuclear transport factor 2 [Histoplasma capsulatum G186AR]EEH04933.1 nuclear transport factor 2 [Histoplasma capsulatum G186AR]
MADLTAEEFVKFYYETFDGEKRDGLSTLYRDKSMLTFETSCVQGSDAIIKQLMSLPFQKVQHVHSTIDAQPTEEGGVVVLVIGALMVDEETKPMNFSQHFHLRPNGSGSYYVYNDIFKLVYPQ